MEKPEGLPSAAEAIAREHPAVWRAYSALGKATSEAGPLNGATLRLVKLALAIGASREGAVHSHTRRALAEGIATCLREPAYAHTLGARARERVLARYADRAVAGAWLDAYQTVTGRGGPPPGPATSERA